MKRIFLILSLVCVITISAYSHISADSISKVSIIAAPKNVLPQYVAYFVMVIDAFPQDPIMVRIANAESSFNPHAKNPSSSARGMYQILASTWKDAHCEGNVYDPHDNINCAIVLYEASGTHPWDASKNNW